jgi:uncharacterized protein YecT (DUF1311 family)
MKKRWMGLVLCLVIGQVQAASFDCAKAGTKVEKLICANDELSKLDEALAAAYADALKSTDPDSLKAEQKAWLKVRNACTDTTCVRQTYEARLVVLRPSTALSKPPDQIGQETAPMAAKPKPGQLAARPANSPHLLPVRVFAREADKSAAISKILAGHTLHYSTPEGKELPFCTRLQGALRAGQGVEFVEPEFTTQDVNDSRLARYRRCAIKETEISSDFKIRYSPAVLIGTEAVLANLKLFRFDADNNPANGLEEFLYGEQTRDQRQFSRIAMTGYDQMDLKRCKHLDGAPAEWSSPLADGLSAIIRFESRYYILSMSIYEMDSFNLGISNLRANKKHKWDATACAWSTFPFPTLK